MYGNNQIFSMIPELKIENTTGGGPTDITPPTVDDYKSYSVGYLYGTSSSNLDIGGTASDDTGVVTQVTWSNNRGGSGTASWYNKLEC